MSKVLVTDTYLTNIGNSIRNKSGTTTKYKPNEMANAIDKIEVAGVSSFNINSLEYTGGSLYELIVSIPSSLDTSNCFNMRGMFAFLSSLTTVNLDNFDTSKVTSMAQMFLGCEALLSLDLSGFDTRNVTEMYYMFTNCKSLTFINFGINFSTSKVTNFSSMFGGCSSLTSIDLSNFNTSNGTNFGYMFRGCSSLTSIDLSNFNTSNGANFQNMFEECSSLTSIIFGNNFTLVEATDYSGMFLNCQNLNEETLNSILKIMSTYLEKSSYYFRPEKTLKEIGLSEAQANICVTLSNWQELKEKGWTTGYETNNA